MRFTKIDVYWSMILIWTIVGIVYLYLIIKQFIMKLKRVIKNRRKLLVLPEWAGAYSRRVPSTELVNLWKCDLCPHTSLEDCALRGCIGLPREVYLTRAAKPAGESGQNPEDPVPSYADATTSTKPKVKSLRKKRGSGRAHPLSTDPTAEGSHLLGSSSSSSYDAPRGQRSNSYSLTDDTLQDGPPPYSYPSGSATN